MTRLLTLLCALAALTSLLLSFQTPAQTKMVVQGTLLGLDGEGIIVELAFARPHFAVHLKNVDGTPYAAKMPTRSTNPFRKRPQKSDEWTLTLTPLLESAQFFAKGQVLATRHIAPSDFHFDVTPGCSYLLAATGPGQEWKPRTIHIPEGAGRVDVDYVVHPSKPNGVLQLTATDWSGAPLLMLVNFSISPASGGPVLFWHPGLRWFRPEDKIGSPIALPPGKYRVHASGSAQLDSHHGTLIGSTVNGAYSGTFEIASNETTHVEARLDVGAKLRIQLDGAVLREDRVAVQTRWPEGLFYSAEVTSKRAEIWLHRKGEPTRPVLFAAFGYENTTAAGIHLSSYFPIGTTATSELVGTGTYTLCARMPGGRVAFKEVKLVGGEVLNVTLKFD